jgi:hypothetical protein
MADITWPGGLPQELPFEGFSMTAPSGAVRVDMDAGPAFQRQRYTAAPAPLKFPLWLTTTEYQVFMDFYVVSLAHGALPFNWVHPITGEAVEMQFDVSNPPRITAKSGLLYEITLSLEVLP